MAEALSRGNVPAFYILSPEASQDDPLDDRFKGPLSRAVPAEPIVRVLKEPMGRLMLISGGSRLEPQFLHMYTVS